jgi:hypothetical protein
MAVICRTVDDAFRSRKRVAQKGEHVILGKDSPDAAQSGERQQPTNAQPWK